VLYQIDLNNDENTKEKFVQYWIRNSLVVAISIATSACSVFTNDSHHERNYRVNDGLNIPGNLSQPYQDPAYDLEPVQHTSSELSADYLTKAPAQVLTFASGSWVNEGDLDARVFLDKSEGIEDLEQFIWQAIDDLFTEQQVTAEEKQPGYVVSNWYSIERPVDVWWWEEERELSRQKFKFIVETEEHKRTASVNVELNDYSSKNEELTDVLKQRLEVAALNVFIEQFDFNYRHLLVELNKSRGIVSLQMGFDDKGNSAFITEQNAKNIFERFPGFLERVGFTIDEVEPSRNLIFATYEDPDESVWDSIWGDEIRKLPLEPGQYQLLVTETNTGGTAITWLDFEGETLEPGTLGDVLQVLLTMLEEAGIDIQ
jgi:outer membrane protein assembly factor BamC